MIATAVATSFQSQDPQFLKTDPQFLKSAETPEKQPILGGKNCSWSLKKIFQSGNGCAMCFLQKKWKNSVKFGLSSRSNISLPRIGGHHPVPSLSILSTKRLGTAMYYPCWHPRGGKQKGSQNCQAAALGSQALLGLSSHSCGLFQCGSSNHSPI